MSCQLLTRCQCDAPGNWELLAGKTERWEPGVPGSALPTPNQPNSQLPGSSGLVTVTFKRRKCDLLIKLEFQNVAGREVYLAWDALELAAGM